MALPEQCAIALLQTSEHAKYVLTRDCKRLVQKVEDRVPHHSIVDNAVVRRAVAHYNRDGLELEMIKDRMDS